MQERLSLEYIEALQINEYVETGTIKFSKELDEIWGVSRSKQAIEMQQTNTVNTPRPAAGGGSKWVNGQNGIDRMNGFDERQSINPMHHQMSNGMNNGQNGRSHDLGATDHSLNTISKVVSAAHGTGSGMSGVQPMGGMV